MDYIDINTEISEAKVKEALSHTPQILFEVTESCNLNCVYCALGSVYEWGKIGRVKSWILILHLVC